MSNNQGFRPPRCPSRIEQEAIAWFTRINGEPSAADRRNFERWRKADPAHEEAYREVANAWAKSDALGIRAAAEEAETLKGYLDAIDGVRKRRRRLNAGIATTGVLLALVVGLNVWLQHPYMIQDLSADFVTERAERRMIVLADGSSVLLDAGSALAQQMDGTVRRVRLLRGAAYFDVKTSPVPFIVDAGHGETLVTGTAFSVEVLESDVAVTLARGHVAVSSGRDTKPAILAPGESVRYNNTGLGDVTQVPVEEVLSWRDGRLIFDGARLGDVVQQIGRYRSGRIVIIGSTLADHRVSGNLPLDDPDSALASLRATVGFLMTDMGGKLAVISP